jgi:hypothetical protein
MVGPVARGIRIDAHAADRIGCEMVAGCCWRRMLMMKVGVSHRLAPGLSNP